MNKMENIKQWAVSVCAVIAITAILKYLIPEGKMKKTSEAVLSLIVLAVVLTPFLNSGNAFDSTLNNYDFLSDIEEYESSDAYGEALEKSIGDILTENGIAYKEITVNTNIDSESYINISNIEIELQNTDEKDKVCALLSEKLGIDSSSFSVR